MRRALALTAILVVAAASAAAGQTQKPPDLATAKVVDLTHPFDEKTIYWPTSPSAFELKSLADGKTPGGLVLSLEHLLHARARRNAPGRPEPFRQGRASRRPDPRPQPHRPGRRHRRPRGRREKPGLSPDARRREGLGEGARVGSGRRHRAPPDRLERALAGPEGLPRRRHARRRLEAALPFVRGGGREVPRLPQGRRARRRHRLDRLRRVEGLRRPRDRQRANVFGLENVAHLEELPESGAWAIALPMKIAGGSGGPLRIVALLP